MITKGHWTGQYKYGKETIQKATGFAGTNFDIEILSIENDNFVGTVKDDLSTGGTKGIGEIVGKVVGENIEFIKQMPVMTSINKDGTMKTYNKKQRKIYYSGTFSKDGKSISGEWRFKFGFVWIGFIPIPIPPTKGIWIMKLKV